LARGGDIRRRRQPARPVDATHYHEHVSLKEQGPLIEEHVRRIAAHLGVPDFVYRPVHISVGSGTREVSDGLLVAGHRGVIVQVKSRSRVGLADSPDRAAAWCVKEGRAALKQGTGTRRQLARGGIKVRSFRGFERVLPAADDWPIVVVIDYPSVPLVTLGSLDEALFISLNDWLNLHAMVRSTIGIIDYVHRALGSGIAVPLGRESDRYRELATADAAWASAISTGVPRLLGEPLEPPARLAADFFDELMEKVADPEGSAGWSPDEYLYVIEQLDAMPIGMRVHIGQKMVATFRAMSKARSRRSFFFGDRESGARLCFLYDYFDPKTHEPDGSYFLVQTAAYGVLRHHHAMEVGWDPDIPTLTIGVLHDPDRGRRYSFALFQGAAVPSLPSDVRATLEAEYGIFTGREVVRPV